jgi:hypothetical protein
LINLTLFFLISKLISRYIIAINIKSEIFTSYQIKLILIVSALLN